MSIVHHGKHQLSTMANINCPFFHGKYQWFTIDCPPWSSSIVVCAWIVGIDKLRLCSTKCVCVYLFVNIHFEHLFSVWLSVCAWIVGIDKLCLFSFICKYSFQPKDLWTAQQTCPPQPNIAGNQVDLVAAKQTCGQPNRDVDSPTNKLMNSQTEP